MSLNPKNKAGTSVLTREGPADYTKLAADAFPIIQLEDAGSILEVTDTGDRHRWSGTKWVQTGVGGRALTADFNTEVALGSLEGYSAIHKYGVNPDIDIASGFEAIWNGGGDYTGQDPIVAETLETFSSSANDTGTLVSSGTATGGSRLTLIDTTATFVTDGVAVGDIALNDTQQDSGVVTAVTETELTFITMDGLTINVLGDGYRIVTSGSTGPAVVKLEFLLDGNLANETSEYVILNGVTPVDTVGTYRRHSRARTFGAAPNVGILTTRQKTTTANIMMVLPIGASVTLIAAYTIPADKRALFTSWFASLAKKQASFSIARLMVRPPNCTYSVLEETVVASTGTSAFQREYMVPKDTLAPGTDIKIMADSDANDSAVAAGFDLLLIDL